MRATSWWRACARQCPAQTAKSPKLLAASRVDSFVFSPAAAGGETAGGTGKMVGRGGTEPDGRRRVPGARRIHLQPARTPQVGFHYLDRKAWSGQGHGMESHDTSIRGRRPRLGSRRLRRPPSSPQSACLFAPRNRNHVRPAGSMHPPPRPPATADRCGDSCGLL
jgi:hypothetical protein